MVRDRSGRWIPASRVLRIGCLYSPPWPAEGPRVECVAFPYEKRYTTSGSPRGRRVRRAEYPTAGASPNKNGRPRWDGHSFTSLVAGVGFEPTTFGL